MPRNSFLVNKLIYYCGSAREGKIRLVKIEAQYFFKRRKMKINEKTQLGISFNNKAIRNYFIKKVAEKDSDTNFVLAEDREGHIERLKKALTDEENKFYLITETVKEMAKKVKIPEQFDASIFAGIPRDRRTLLLGANEFYRYYWDDNSIVCIFGQMKDGWFTYKLFRLDTALGYTFTDATEEANEIALNFIRLITFIDLADVDTVYLKPNQKTGTKKSGNTKNESIFPVTIVDSSWNKYVIRMEGFAVEGHFRFQRYGEGNALRKLIWINSYEKHGYIRTPKKGE